MDKETFRKLATERVADAKALLDAKRWSAAYYLAGYAVECGLKACVLIRLVSEPGLVFEERRYSERCWTHDLTQLIELAGLKAAFNADRAADTELASNWGLVKNWDESYRYRHVRKAEAFDLLAAISDKKHGVLSWVKKYW